MCFTFQTDGIRNIKETFDVNQTFVYKFTGTALKFSLMSTMYNNVVNYIGQSLNIRLNSVLSIQLRIYDNVNVKLSHFLRKIIIFFLAIAKFKFYWIKKL